jgi:branched-subunit amino acid ABC-type transport system permease component
MTWLINFLFVALLICALLLAVRFAVHRYYPGWGTAWAAIVGGAGSLLDSLIGGLPQLLTDVSGLPWTKILAADTANAVVFGCMAAMVILRKIPRKAGA